ncbi:MAG: HAD-IB family phosphatase [Eubacteriales bacterium]|nr:HAD-IB family phosphatase [Eubacteriales bacterium]
MNVYDFDKTILNDDSTKLFLLYCFRKMPRLFFKGPVDKISSFYAYAAGKKSVDRFKENMFGFLPYVSDLNVLLQDFWDRNMWRVEPYYRKVQRPDDLIISASPDFLVRPMAERLGAELIATDMSPFSGKIRGVNCKREEKVRRFRQLYPDASVEAFYSDSLSDTPMAKLADQAWLIVDHEPVPWPFEKSSAGQ